MTSKISSFDLLKENLRRRVWSAALSGLLFFFLFPVTILLQVSYYLDPDRLASAADSALALARAKDQLIANYAGWVHSSNSFLSVMLAILAVVIGISAFSWLHNAKQTDFYHSLPVKRDRLYITVHLASILIAGVPYLIMSLLAGLIIRVNTGSTSWLAETLAGFAGHMCYFLLIYMTTVLATLLTGHVFVGILGTCVFLFYGPSLLFLVTAMMEHFFHNYYSTPALLTALLQRASAFTWMLDIQTPEGLSTEVWAVQKILLALVGSAGLFIAGLFLYRLRRSESAGKAMAFSKTEFWIRLLVTVPIGALGGLIMHSTTDQDGWAWFGILCVSLICALVMEIIYRLDFKALFTHRTGLILSVLLSFVFFSFFRFDLSGYDRYVPDLSRVDSAAISCDAYGDLWSYRELKLQESAGGNVSIDSPEEDAFSVLSRRMHFTDTALIRSIAEKAVSETLKTSSGSGESAAPGADASEPKYGSIQLCWHLKGGRDVFRSYYLDLSCLRQELGSVYDSTAYKQEYYPLYSLPADELAGINYQDISGFHRISFDSADSMQQLFDTYKTELAGLTTDTRREESPVCCLQFKSQSFQEMADKYRIQYGHAGCFNDVGYYPVYPSFTGTLSLLEAQNVHINAQLAPENIAYIRVTDSRSYHEADPAEAGEGVVSTAEARAGEGHAKAPLEITDAAQIRELLSACCTDSLNCSNSYFPRFRGLDVQVYVRPNSQAEGVEVQDRPDWERGEGETVSHDIYYLSLGADKMPAFLKDYFEISGQDLANYTSYYY